MTTVRGCSGQISECGWWVLPAGPGPGVPVLLPRREPGAPRGQHRRCFNVSPSIFYLQVHSQEAATDMVRALLYSLGPYWATLFHVARVHNIGCSGSQALAAALLHGC